MASWEEPHDWRAGELASTSQSSGTVNMNNQVYSNMDWLGSTHDHSGGTMGNNKLGPVSYTDFIAAAAPASPGSTATRLFASGTTFYISLGGTSTYQIVDESHSHAGL